MRIVVRYVVSFVPSSIKTPPKAGLGRPLNKNSMRIIVLPAPLTLRRAGIASIEDEEIEEIDFVAAEKAQNERLREVEVVIPTKDGGDIARMAVYAAPGISYKHITPKNIES